MSVDRAQGFRRSRRRAAGSALLAAALPAAVAVLAGCAPGPGGGPSVGGPVPTATTPATPPATTPATPKPPTTPTPTAPASHPATPPPSSAPRPTPTTGRRWAPTPGQPWQWQLSGQLDESVNVPVYDIDGQEASAATVTRLHNRGRRVVCYLSAGTYEKGRPDAAAFPAAVLGKTLPDWPDERWLDIRRIDLLSAPLTKRFDDCRAKGFDAVEPDNVDGYTNNTGFPLTAADQLTFNRWVADQVHARGMGVALKNDGDQAAALAPAFDFALDEECLQYDECDVYRPFVTAGKAVLHVEYTDEWPSGRPCAVAGFSSMLKRRDLDAWRKAC